MKMSTQIRLVTLLFMSSSLYASTPEAVDTTATKQKDLFVLKTEKQFVGAQVEVYNSNGELVISRSLQKRKLVIDFREATFGIYTIRIIKGQAKQEFKYIKN